MSSRRELYPTLLLTFAVVVWGCTPRVTEVAAPHADPLTLTMLRAAPTALFRDGRAAVPSGAAAPRP